MPYLGVRFFGSHFFILKIMNAGRRSGIIDEPVELRSFHLVIICNRWHWLDLIKDAHAYRLVFLFIDQLAISSYFQRRLGEADEGQRLEFGRDA